MGVKGLWRILEPSRRRVDLEYFRGKRIAIDMNIWLHQALKARARGGRNLHLAILFRRICKLLFFGIRPVFVFDGAVPELKKATMATRRIYRVTAQEKSNQARDRLLKRLFRRLAECATKSQSKSKELAAEFVERFNSMEAIRKAELDVEMYGSQSSSIDAVPPTGVLQLEEEQESASQLAWDYVGNSHSIDLQSEAFNSLPVQAQLQVILILLNAPVQPSSPSAPTGAVFSQTQVSRLIARRDLTLKKEELESRMNEALVVSVVPQNLPSGSDISVIAQRIASQDEGHTILLRKRSSKERADELKERLNRLLENPVYEPMCDAKEVLENGSKLAKSPRGIFQAVNDCDTEIMESLLKNSKKYSSSESKVRHLAYSGTPSANGEEAVDFGDQTNHTMKLEKDMKEVVANTVIPKADDVEKEGESKPSKQPNFDASSTELNEFTDSLTDSTTLEASNYLEPLSSQLKETEDFDRTGGFECQQRDVEVETAKAEVTADSSSSDSGEFADVSGPPTPIPSVEMLPKTQTFLDSEIEEDLAIDDDVLRVELEKLERQAQETTTSCVAEAQTLVQLFGFPLINSPEEAEAQCCHLQQLGLVDIVASDDSDVWVFGATIVCRHLFGGDRNKGKLSPTSLYSLEDIREQLGLDRHQFVRIALLCGSDYTNGLDKIGPIKALEILSAFTTSSDSALTPEEHEIVLPLEEFKRTCQGGGGGRWASIKFPAGNPICLKDIASLRVIQAATRLKYANEFRDLPALDTDWSEDAGTNAEDAKPAKTTSQRRKSDEKPDKKTRKRKKRK
ncbi:unnamed protein product [Hydatigera taeniaeformis]|uniref:XPGN domain-containing protein n=1 Tax=Hydatigena taeniaeformis TaxID=6205 RepID=A0A0R3X6F0_HYDTA|nr:unnamed protein product [Hydatigera taeniaeformis]